MRSAKEKTDEKEKEYGSGISVRKKEAFSQDVSELHSLQRFITAKDRKKVRRVFFYVFTALFLCAVFTVICVVLFFRTKYVEVIGNDFYPSGEIIASYDFSGSPNLLLLSESKIENQVILKNPYIKKVTLKRDLPDTAILEVVEEAPKYYTVIADEYFVLSDSLRVIERFKTEEEFQTLAARLIRLDTPPLRSAIVGSKLGLARDPNYDYMLDLVTQLQSSYFGPYINSIDATDKFHISIIVFDGRYRISFGDSTDLEVKLDFAKAIMDKSFNERTVADIDVEYLESAIITLCADKFEY